MRPFIKILWPLVIFNGYRMSGACTSWINYGKVGQVNVAIKYQLSLTISLEEVFYKWRDSLRASASGLLTILVRRFYPLNHLFVHYLLLARLIDQYCFARCRLSASSVIVCNARGRSADAGRVAGPAADSPTLTAGQSCYVPLGPVWFSSWFIC